MGVGTPLIGFGIWGTIDFRDAGALSEIYRLAEELIISGLAAYAFFLAEQPQFALILASLSIIYHSLVYLIGDRLLKAK